MIHCEAVFWQDPKDTSDISNQVVHIGFAKSSALENRG